ncbi:MAG: hypothetical protein HY866_18725 [Chloroflexi bacterium]|nr:hypothetical protein [Chloroflexota bacterium]
MPDDDLKTPGQKAPESGQYEIVGPRGGDAGGQERTVVKGKTLPPTPKPDQKYQIVDKTNTKGNSPKKK